MIHLFGREASESLAFAIEKVRGKGNNHAQALRLWSCFTICCDSLALCLTGRARKTCSLKEDNYGQNEDTECQCHLRS